MDMRVRRVDDMLVGLVGDDERVMLLGETQDRQQLGPREDLAARVRRVADDDGLGLLREGLGELVRIEVERRRAQGHVDGLGAGEDRIGGVVLVERREDDHLVARIAGGHHRDHHRFGAAAGDDEVLVGVDRQAAEPVDLLGEGLTEARGAPGHGILVMRTARGAFQGGQQFLGRGEVREALRQVDGPVLVGQAGHPADDGFGETGETAGGRRHAAG